MPCYVAYITMFKTIGLGYNKKMAGMYLYKRLHVTYTFPVRIHVRGVQYTQNEQYKNTYTLHVTVYHLHAYMLCA